METVPQIVNKPRSFLSTLAWGVSGLAMVLVVSGTAIIIYGMNIADRKAGSVFELVARGVQGLPELEKALPPALADLLNDQRRPDYADKVQVTVKLANAAGEKGGVRPIVEVVNQGPELISLLSARLVVVNDRGEPVFEQNEWLATPVAADHDWRGPLMPGSSRLIPGRRIGVGASAAGGAFSARIEITDLRVWKNEKLVAATNF